jgi:hypothetical protein
MSTIIPEEKKLKDALEWISIYQDKKNIEDLLKEACFKYNLTPKEEEYLRRLFSQQTTSPKI